MYVRANFVLKQSDKVWNVRIKWSVYVKSRGARFNKVKEDCYLHFLKILSCRNCRSQELDARNGIQRLLAVSVKSISMQHSGRKCVRMDPECYAMMQCPVCQQRIPKISNIYHL